MSRYIIVDTYNLFFRCRHAAQGDAFTKAGMAMHILFRSLRKAWREFKADHVVFTTEGRSWRYDVYPQYKANRRTLREMMSQREREEDEVFGETLKDFIAFISEKTACTVLNSPKVEGDDWVARWIDLHPDDDHVILSGDSDFVQLLAPNVRIYNGVADHTLLTEGIRNDKGELVEFSIKSDSKLQIGKPNPEFKPEPRWWERVLFTKCVRGDPGDNIFSAYPGVRMTSKTKPSIESAWADRDEKGYAWNNFMLQKWADGDKEVLVLDAYKRNEQLINLRCQPDEIRDLMDTCIVQAVQKEPVPQVGIHFLRFCDKHSLVNLGREAADHAAYLNAPYTK